ncbi:hypothetical protein [Salmonella enterica]|uniref:hypothetical protein n=1 Tax=Salmonella enterica TaxID=28901 RepID=UPI0005960DB5|nr:hypothetical protein [Salmonella enterica]
MQNKPTPEEVKNARVAAGLTLKKLLIFWLSTESWQMKESAGKPVRSLSIGEYQYLCVITNMHPSYRPGKKIACHTCKCRYKKHGKETGLFHPEPKLGGS